MCRATRSGPRTAHVVSQVVHRPRALLARSPEQLGARKSPAFSAWGAGAPSSMSAERDLRTVRRDAARQYGGSQGAAVWRRHRHGGGVDVDTQCMSYRTMYVSPKKVLGSTTSTKELSGRSTGNLDVTKEDHIESTDGNSRIAAGQAAHPYGNASHRTHHPLFAPSIFNLPNLSR